MMTILVMESKVSMCYKKLCGLRPSNQLLTNQLQRLCMQLDVYPETESHDDSMEGAPGTFPGEYVSMDFQGYQ